MPDSFDLIVIGTGAGGSAPATKCRKAGWRVAIVDDQPFGGTCALRGCDPKKVLIGGADLVAWHHRMRGHGAAGDAAIDWAGLMKFKKTFTAPVPLDTERSYEQLGIETLHGEARFSAPDRLVVGDRELEAKHFVIAAGASPRALGIPGEDCVVTSTTFLELPKLPPRIAFIGAGYVSMEFAHLVAHAGAKATIFGRGKPLTHFDEALVDHLTAYTRAIGVRVELGAAVTRVDRSGSGLRVHTDGRDAPGDEFDLVVHGAGRVPNTARLELARAGVRTDAEAAIEVNEYLQSPGNPRVYAVGDVTRPKGKLPLTPVAAHEGAIVASNLLRGNTKQPNYRGTPSVVFTVPPLAGVGLTEAGARAAGIDVEVKSGDTSAWFSNRRTREPLGMFKTIVDRATGCVVGAHLLGTNADEAINLFALAVRMGLNARELKQAIYSYPTSSSDVPYML